jgi:hypothetical protein
MACRHHLAGGKYSVARRWCKGAEAVQLESALMFDIGYFSPITPAAYLSKKRGPVSAGSAGRQRDIKRCTRFQWQAGRLPSMTELFWASTTRKRAS